MFQILDLSAKFVMVNAGDDDEPSEEVYKPDGGYIPRWFAYICMNDRLREPVKYYFADFVRKGGGGTPQIRNFFFARKKIRKGEYPPNP